MIGGRYAIPAHTPMLVLSQALHRAHRGLGPGRRRVQPRPHRRPSGWPRIPPNAYKPFGTGAAGAASAGSSPCRRPCWCSACWCSASTSSTTCDYQLKTKTTLTIKPDDFHILVRPRPDVHIDRAPGAPRPERAVAAAGSRAGRTARRPARHAAPVLFGSNLGTAESIATRLAQEGTERGFAVTLGALDDHVDDLPHGGAAMIVCSSYNGTPPDNAAAFCRWIARRRPPMPPPGVAYTVFGCGNTEWAATYQAVPDRCSTSSSPRTADAGSATAARATRAGDFDAAYRAWHGGLWADLAAALDLPAEVAEPRPRPDPGCRSR